MTLTIDRLAQTGRWRRRAPMEKAVLALGLLALALALPPWPGSAMVLLAAWTAALAGAGIPVGEWLRLNAVPMGFALTGAAALAVELHPDGLALAADSGARALAVTLRATASLSCLLLLAVTTPTPDLLRGLRRLGLPAEIAELALLSWRFVFLLLDCAAAIRIAQDSRLGWHGWRRSLRSAGLLIAQLLPRAMERARRLEIGLAARGHDGSLPMLSPARPVSSVFLATVLAGQAALAGASLWLS
ncbi:cobalt ECF transporter T component CbiQ [Magnetospirillum sp. SS-4]|uniref:cobalt ECF transporter T component CbiQ n=1 Tax=Magnetospirillum sp. SS-4 TaxID=2681465 RepID=UPI0015727A19|nr:cobalt ECF transporter T component CbiQ [Magnetospirillum sp. SS-4]